MGNGYMGKVLWVDLTKGTLKEETIEDDIYRRFLSGYGLGVKVIFDRQPASIDPLGPEAIFGIITGLLTDTGAHFSGRWMLVGKSPLTGGWGDANCGGNLSPALKRTGFDGIFFTGKSKKPVYLLIEGDNKELKDASELWGTDALETEQALIDRHGRGFRVACIGQGGENLSLISGVCNDRGRIAARSGLGAVMGSKKLKAICVKGNKRVDLHDRQRVLALSKAFRGRLERDQMVDKVFSGKIPAFLGRVLKFFKTQPAMAGELFKFTLRIWGTSGITGMSAETGDSPVKNWKGVGFKEFPIGERSCKISDDAVTRYETKKYRCHACPLGCGGICHVNDGPNPPGETHKAEYETLCAFGTLLLNDDLPRIFEINDMLNRAGIDTISCGVTVAWAMEAFERGLLTEEDTDGIRLTWGNSAAVVEVVKRIIEGEGIGELLQDGVKKAAEKLGKGSDEFAFHAGGQELPMHDGRYDAGYGLAYEVEPTPGRHTISSYTYQDLMALHRKTKRVKAPKMMHTLAERLKVRGKGADMSVVSSYVDLANGCGMCLFGLAIGGNPPLAEWINAATGWNYSFEDYLKIGRRIKTLRQAFNVREGIHPEDTRMPSRARGKPPLTEGPLADITPDFDGLGREYRLAMGWDPVTGRPFISTLEDLGLTEVKEALKK